MSHIREESYRFVSAMMRALAHTVRGDLSVVTNDLSYFSTLLPEGETDRSRSRCASVVANLSRLVLLQGELGISEVSEEEFCRAIGVTEVAAPLSSTVKVDPGKFSLVMQEVEKVLGGERESSYVRRYKPASGGTRAEVIVECALTQGLDGAEEVHPSLSQYAAARRGERYVVGAAAVDLVLFAHGWESRVDERRHGVVWSASQREAVG